MKQGMIKISKEFVTDFGLKEWVGFEYPIDYDTEDPSETMKMVRQMTIDSWKNSQNGTTITDAPEEVVITKRSTDVVTALKEDIRSCKDVKVLESYRLLAKTNPELQFVYDIKMEELTPKQ